MKKEAKNTDPEALRTQLEDLVRNLRAELQSEELRSRVLALIPVFHTLRSLGQALIQPQDARAAKGRLLHYFLKYPRTVIDGDELLVISGIQEYARRVRELRVEDGWLVATGVTLNEMATGDDEEVPEYLAGMMPDQYVLLTESRDGSAADRWKTANEIRNAAGSVRDKLLRFLRTNVGQPVTNEELRYVAGDKTEWARRVRELRTELGWLVATKTTGRPDLGVGVYVLQADRQSPPHDRRIPDNVRREVLRRDGYRCRKCKWSHNEWNPSDPRHLELHHIEHHAKGGANATANLQTLCVVCHDRVHKGEA